MTQRGPWAVVARWVLGSAGGAALAVALGVPRDRWEVVIAATIAVGASIARPERAALLLGAGGGTAWAAWQAGIAPTPAVAAVVSACLAPPAWVTAAWSAWIAAAMAAAALAVGRIAVADWTPPALQWATLAAWVAAGSAVGEVAVAWWGAAPTAPHPAVRLDGLDGAPREAAARAVALLRAVPDAADAPVRAQLTELTGWVVSLADATQQLAADVRAVDAWDAGARLDALAVAPDAADPFTRDRRAATVQHLRGVLAHRAALALELDRTEALGACALACMEEAIAGLAVARQRPGASAPDGLAAMLTHLRAQARSAQARRASVWEVDGVASSQAPTDAASSQPAR